MSFWDDIDASNLSLRLPMSTEGILKTPAYATYDTFPKITSLKTIENLEFLRTPIPKKKLPQSGFRKSKRLKILHDQEESDVKEEKEVKEELITPPEEFHIYTKKERDVIIARYREKRSRRCFKNKPIYESRRRFAVNRFRYAGRFVSITPEIKARMNELREQGLSTKQINKKILHEYQDFMKRWCAGKNIEFRLTGAR